MDQILADWERLIQKTVMELEESTRVIEACTREIKDQNRKARFIAQCFGLPV